ncbi:MAG TPA: CHAT domain-containing protein [Burkholderiaceae bacterium]|nr:CHAT domain-containing protein [Burkholderiaceae bacterium]
MIDADLLQPLLHGLEPDEDLQHRRLLLEALTALPMSPQAWRAAAPTVTRNTHLLLEQVDLDGPTCELLARVPLRSARIGLQRVAGDALHPHALAVATALAHVGDPGGLDTLLQAFSAAPSTALAAALAGLPLEDLPVNRAHLAPGLAPAAAGEDPDAVAMRRMWSAIAVARCGDLEPLEELWDGLVRPPGFFAQHTRQVLFRAPPPLFHGEPAQVVAELAHVRPLPEPMQRFLLGLREHDYDDTWRPRRADVGEPRDAKLLVAGLTGAFTADGDPAPAAAAPADEQVPPLLQASAVRVARRMMQAPWRGLELALDPAERPLLRHVPADLSAQVIEAGLEALGRQDPQLPEQAPAWAVGNAMVDLAGALPAQVPLRVASLLQKPHMARLPADALAWTLARAGAGTTVQALSPYIVGSRGRERTGWMTWLARSAEQVGAPAPVRGAGGATAVLRVPQALVDDLQRASRPRPGLETPGGHAAPQVDVDVIQFDKGMDAFAAPLPAARPEPPAAATTQPAPHWRMAQPPQALPPEAEPPATPATPATCTLFPDIAPDDLHPVAGATVRFTVALALQAVAGTQGGVMIPAEAPETVHTLRVHLLFGSQSAWSTLTCCAAQGGRTEARFALPAPTVAGDRELVPVRANFYLNQRWCGEGQRLLDVRRDAAVAPLPAIPLPEIAPWRNALTLDPGAQPPDLIVRIQKGAVLGEYVWSCLSPHLDLAAPANPADARTAFGQDAATFVRLAFAPLAGKSLSQLDIAEVCGAGESIYNNTPKHFRDSYWALWRAAKEGSFSFDSIQIVTDEPCVPWELMRLSDRARAPDEAPEFLAIRHSVGRWLAGESSALSQCIHVHKLAVAASDYAGVATGINPLPWAAKERDLLTATYHAEPVALKSGDMLAFLEGGGVQAAHFACHGKMSISDPDASLLVMEDSPANLKPKHVARREVCDGLGRQHPLIFLNACEVGGTAASLSLVAGFPAAFLYAGAAALVSPLWAVNDAHAHRIAEDFYQQVFKAGAGKPLGAVLRDLRARWKEEAHLTFLAYVLYGDPLAHVSYEPTA